MRKCLVVLCVLLVLAAGVQLAYGEHGSIADCGCPDDVGVSYSCPTYYKSLGDSTHIITHRRL